MNFRRRLIKSFTYAFRGLRYAWQHEINFRIQLTIALLVIIGGAMARLSRLDWLIIILVIGTVLVLELINSSMEALLDLVKPRLHEYAEVVKDVMAGAVFLASLVAVVIGIMIFVPYIF